MNKMMFNALSMRSKGIYKNVATSTTASIFSNIAPSNGSLSNLLLGNRQVTEASGNYAYWDFTGATEDLTIDVQLIGIKSIDKIVFAWGLNTAGTIVGSNTIDTDGFYFPNNSGELISLESYNLTPTSIPFTTPTSRLQEYTFTQRTASSISVVISKDMNFQQLYLCGIEVWGN